MFVYPSVDPPVPLPPFPSLECSFINFHISITPFLSSLPTSLLAYIITSSQ